MNETVVFTPLEFIYCNHKGETARRSVKFIKVWYGSTEYYKEPQWLLRGYDLDRRAERDFAFKNFVQDTRRAISVEDLTDDEIAEIAKPIDPLQYFIDVVKHEIKTATEKWPPMNSAHEAFGVLYEEVDELWQHVKTKQKNRDLDAMYMECVQVAAMAARFAIEICNEERGRK